MALSIASRPKVGTSALFTSAIFMGIGIAGMHYIGMAALEMTATIHYNPTFFLISVVVAVVASLVALKLSLRFRRQRMVNKTPQLLSALVMAAAILGLHYTGMAAATFKADYQRHIEHSNFGHSSMAFLIASFTFGSIGIPGS